MGRTIPMCYCVSGSSCEDGFQAQQKGKINTTSTTEISELLTKGWHSRLMLCKEKKIETTDKPTIGLSLYKMSHFECLQVDITNFHMLFIIEIIFESPSLYPFSRGFLSP